MKVYEVREGEEVVYTGTAPQIARHFGETTKRVHQCVWIRNYKGSGGSFCGKYTIHLSKKKYEDLNHEEQETPYEIIRRHLRVYGNCFTSCDPETIREDLLKDGIMIDWHLANKMQDKKGRVEKEDFWVLEVVNANETSAGVQK